MGPVGLLTAAWAKYRGANKVICIDNVKERLELIKNQFDVEVIDFSKTNLINRVKELLPEGPDVSIDCCGWRDATGLLHKIESTLVTKTDSPTVIQQGVFLTKKGGIVVLIGDYFYNTSDFPIGPFMEKHLTMKGGQIPVQKYWHKILDILKEGKFDPTFIITHTLSLEQGDKAYEMFDKKQEGCIKILLKTGYLGDKSKK